MPPRSDARGGCCDDVDRLTYRNARFIDIHGEGEVCPISFDDRLEILADPPPTLAEVTGRGAE